MNAQNDNPHRECRLRTLRTRRGRQRGTQKVRTIADGWNSDVTVHDLRRASPIMSLEAARNLSIPDLFHLLGEKLDLECTRLQEAPLPPVMTPVSELESEVRAQVGLSISLNAGPHGPHCRLKLLKPTRAISWTSLSPLCGICGIRCSR